MATGRRRRRDDRGAAAVETALLLPLILVVLFGVVAFGILFSQNLAVSNAAREGARLAVVGYDSTNQLSEDDIKSRIETEILPGSGLGVPSTIPENTVHVDIDRLGDGATYLPERPCAGADPGAEVQATVTYKTSALSFIPPVLPGMDFGEITLTGTGTYRCEYR